MRKFFSALLFAHTLFASPSMHPMTYEGIQEANKLIETKAYDKALLLFTQLIDETSPQRRYDHAFIQNALGYLWIRKEDFTQAETAYQKALDYRVLPKEMELSIMLTLSQLFIQQGAYEKGLKQLSAWHKHKAPDALSSRLMMIAYISLDQKEEGLIWCNKAIELSKEPGLQLYQTKLSLELQLAKDSEAIGTLRTLLEHFNPELIYFKQLAFLYSKYDEDEKSAALLESAYQMGLLKQKEDLLLLASLLHQQGAALKAAQIISTLLPLYPDDEKLLSYSVALELETKETKRALSLLQEEYEHFKSEKVALQLAQLYAQEAQWDKTIFYASKLINEPKGVLIYAIALAQIGKTSQALRLFKKCESFDTTRRDARMWLHHLNN